MASAKIDYPQTIEFGVVRNYNVAIPSPNFVFSGFFGIAKLGLNFFPVSSIKIKESSRQ